MKRHRQQKSDHPYNRERASQHTHKIAGVIRILQTDEYAGLPEADDALHALRKLAREIKSWEVLAT